MKKESSLLIPQEETVVNTEDLIDALKVEHEQLGLDVYEKETIFFATTLLKKIIYTLYSSLPNVNYTSRLFK
jgi:lactate dehydrogenase-like 2-hydroxyacid dehydrogenase